MHRHAFVFSFSAHFFVICCCSKLLDCFFHCLENASKNAYVSMGIDSPVFIMDNARIHHYRGLDADPEVNQMVKNFLPPYSPFLNPIENVFSVWKNLVIRGNAENKQQLRSLISSKLEEITHDHCEAFYRKMKGYVIRSGNGEIILE